MNTDAILPFFRILTASSSSVPYSITLAGQCCTQLGIPPLAHPFRAQIARLGENRNEPILPMVSVLKLPRPHFQQLHAPLPLGEVMLVFASELACMAARAILVIDQDPVILFSHDNIPLSRLFRTIDFAGQALVRSTEARLSHNPMRHQLVEARLPNIEQVLFLPLRIPPAMIAGHDVLFDDRR